MLDLVDVQFCGAISIQCIENIAEVVELALGVAGAQSVLDLLLELAALQSLLDALEQDLELVELYEAAAVLVHGMDQGGQLLLLLDAARDGAEVFQQVADLLHGELPGTVLVVLPEGNLGALGGEVRVVVPDALHEEEELLEAELAVPIHVRLNQDLLHLVALLGGPRHQTELVHDLGDLLAVERAAVVFVQAREEVVETHNVLAKLVEDAIGYLSVLLDLPLTLANGALDLLLALHDHSVELIDAYPFDSFILFRAPGAGVEDVPEDLDVQLQGPADLQTLLGTQPAGALRVVLVEIPGQVVALHHDQEVPNLGDDPERKLEDVDAHLPNDVVALAILVVASVRAAENPADPVDFPLFREVAAAQTQLLQSLHDLVVVQAPRVVEVEAVEDLLDSFRLGSRQLVELLP
mmetsp:Transcript_149809/g.481190  ORF Transcript_149809/g.481190 Transcript_149809/m.481190 type:complete len:409 (-) Transcript_149809:1409-2635(-)